VPNALIDKYAIVGSAKRCAERMRALEHAGATMMGVRTALELNAQYDWESNVRTLSAALKA
jgi:alkanesulfonate monooxygenase SsuD/methylene tetrahydromethanopterin reductase-like flavin-dependent oxidoreductase (luciferase family)